MDAQQFLSEFSHIASAPNGIQNLRQMIYNLAITGDLTQQVTEDADAESLLRTIESTKASLIEKKTFKRSPKLEDQPLHVPTHINLPDSWRWSRLVDIGEINPKNEAEDGMLAAFIPMDGVPQLHSGKLKVEQRRWGEIKKGFTHFADGDVVLAKITPCFENGKAAVITKLTNGIGAGTTELHVVRPLHPLVEPAYIYIFLRSPYFTVEGIGNMTGTAGQKRLPTEYFATKAFPLPPLAEQKRIVAKVDELMALCDKLEAQQQERQRLCKLTRTAVLDAITDARSSIELRLGWTRLQQNWSLITDYVEGIEGLRRTIFDLAIAGKLTQQNPSEDAGKYLRSLEVLKEKLIAQRHIRRPKYEPESRLHFVLPSNWRWTSLQNLSQDIFYGYTEKAIERAEGVRFLRITDIQNDKVKWQSVPSCDINEKQYEANKIVNGDILIARTGGTIGKTYLVSGLDRAAVFASYLIKFAPLDLVNSNFVKLFTQSNLYWNQLIEASSGTGQPNVNATSLKALSIPIPPIEEQDRIVAKTQELTNLCDMLKAQLITENNVKKTLAEGYVSKLIGIRIEDKEKMKAPRTELVSTLSIGISPANRDHAPLAVILIRNNGELPAKTLWSMSGLEEIDVFYQQLKTEMAKGWIVQREVAYMRKVETS